MQAASAEYVENNFHGNTRVNNQQDKIRQSQEVISLSIKRALVWYFIALRMAKKSENIDRHSRTTELGPKDWPLDLVCLRECVENMTHSSKDIL